MALYPALVHGGHHLRGYVEQACLLPLGVVACGCGGGGGCNLRVDSLQRALQGCAKGCTSGAEMGLGTVTGCELTTAGR